MPRLAAGNEADHTSPPATRRMRVSDQRGIQHSSSPRYLKRLVHRSPLPPPTKLTSLLVVDRRDSMERTRDKKVGGRTGLLTEQSAQPGRLITDVVTVENEIGRGPFFAAVGTTQFPQATCDSTAPFHGYRELCHALRPDAGNAPRDGARKYPSRSGQRGPFSQTSHTSPGEVAFGRVDKQGTAPMVITSRWYRHLKESPRASLAEPEHVRAVP